MHCKNPTVCEQSIGALMNLTGSGAATCEAIFSAGAIGPIVAALRTHDNNSNVCEPGCFILKYLTFGSEAIRMAVVRMGALGPLIAALRTHGQIPQVSWHVSCALRNLAFESDDRKAAIVGAGALGPLIAALRSHVAFSGVCDSWGSFEPGDRERYHQGADIYCGRCCSTNRDAAQPLSSAGGMQKRLWRLDDTSDRQ